MKFLWRGLWNKRKRKTNKNRKLFQVAILCSKALNTFPPLGLGGNILGFNERLLIGQNSSGREVGWGKLKDNKYSVPDPKLLKVISVHPCKWWNYNQAGVGSPQKCWAGRNIVVGCLHVAANNQQPLRDRLYQIEAATQSIVLFIRKLKNLDWWPDAEYCQLYHRFFFNCIPKWSSEKSLK